ncbi:MAG TPA: septum formation initiator family protein [Blastocatellia bacterium]
MSEVINPYWGRGGAGRARARSKATAITGSRLSAAIYTVITLVLIGAAYTYHEQTSHELRAAVVQRQAEASRVDELKIETERLATEIQNIKSNPRTIESMARERLGLVRPGDVVIRIVESNQQVPESGAAPADSGERP